MPPRRSKDESEDRGSHTRKGERPTLNTLEKCVQILTLFGEATQTLTVAEIAKIMDLPRSTAYRYIAALRTHGLIELDPEIGGHRLGMKILDLEAGMDRKSLYDLALPYMQRISRETGETVILCGLRENVGVCMEKVEGHHALRVSYELGDTYPLHAAATGKAIFAHLVASEQQRVIDAIGLHRLTDTTITDPKRLRDELAKIRKDGFAESHGESIAGTRGLAAPIFSRTGYVSASIGISAPEHRVRGSSRKKMISLVVEAAKALTQGLEAPGGENERNEN